MAECSSSGFRRSAAGPHAAVFATALLVGSGVVYRYVDRCLGQDSTAVPLAPGTLAGLPLSFGDWVGHDVPLDKAVIRSTDTDDHLNRTYVLRGGRESVSIFIGYGVRTRDLMPHRPEVCYPGAGWTLEQSQHVQLTGVDGLVVPCQVHTFGKSGLAQQRIEVLNYYIVDGRYSADVSSLRSEAWKLVHRKTHAVLVQIAAAPQDRPGAGVRDFAAQVAPRVRRLLLPAIDDGGGRTDDPGGS